MSKHKYPSGHYLMLIFLACVMITMTGCKNDLYTGLSEREANEMLAILLSKGISVERTIGKDETNTIRVEETEIPEAVDILSKAGYPKQKFTNMGEVFHGNGFIMSPTEERARFIYAMSEELSRTISDIDGVLTARIHVVLPRNNTLKRDATPSSASVFIRHSQDIDLDGLMPKIKMLIASSIEGLTYDKVSVVMTAADPILDDVANSSSAREQTPFFTMRTTLEVVFGLIAALGIAIVFWMRRRPSKKVQEVVPEPLESGPRLRKVS